jgi:hypothetical protein
MKTTLTGLLLILYFAANAQTPNAPESVVATGINGGGYITFTAPTTVGTGITNYQYSTDNGTSWTACSPAVTASPITISGLTNCTSYQVKIRAVNGSGAGTASATATLTPTNSTDPGITWSTRTSAADNEWRSIAYGNGVFVAVATTGSGNRVMTSIDGIAWISNSSSVPDNNWNSVTYGNGKFVAVASTGTNRVMTSTDGLNWTLRNASIDLQWVSVTYGNGLFVAVSVNSVIGSDVRVMTSNDGITWISSSAAANNKWQVVHYANGLFVAISDDGVGNRVMTSPNGTSWTSRASASDSEWRGLTYGNGLFVAVGFGGALMTSPDGTTWTSRTSAPALSWRSVTYGNGLFVAVSVSGANRVMTSPDGITWTPRSAAINLTWFCVTYGNGTFVAVSNSVPGNRVMTSSLAVAPNAAVISSATPGLSSASMAFTTSLPTTLDAPAVTNIEYSTDDGASWMPSSPAVTTSPLTISGLATGTYQVKLRAVNKVGAGCPSAATSVTIVPNNWTGGTGNWNVASNWSGNAVPDGSSDITISSGTPTLDVDFTLLSGKSLTLSSTGGLVIGSGKRLTIAGTANFGSRPVTFKSDASGTASLGAVTGSLTNATNVTIERYLPAGRKWRLLTAPLTGSTNNSIFYNWQNNDVVSAGTGVEIWGPGGHANPGTDNTGLALGAGSSMRSYGSGWADVTNTHTSLLFDGTTNNGYALFATGPYNNGTSNITPSQAAQPTTLSAKGTLITGDHTKTFNASAANQYFLVGNPYASPVDPRSFTTTPTVNRTNLKSTLWMWDAKPTNGTGLGRYVSFDLSSNQYNVFSDGYPDNSVMIQSGQAFFVQAAASGDATLVFRESSKDANGSHAMMGNQHPTPKALLRLTLQQANGAGNAENLDGAVAVFHSDGKTTLDPLDGSKLMNSSENIFFRREGRNLTFEHHPPVDGPDTIFIRFSNLTAKTYLLQSESQQFSNLAEWKAELKDRFTGKSTLIDLKGMTTLEFDVTSDSLSKGDRFMVVFSKSSASVGQTPDNIPASAGLKLFPNPVRNQLCLRFDAKPSGTYDVRIINSAGARVWQREGISEDIRQLDINTSTLPAGLYRLSVVDAQGNNRINTFVKD